MGERRERERHEMRERIIEAALGLFTTEGYDKTTLRRIADDIEYTPGTIYAYFKDDITTLWDNLHVKLAEYPQPKKTIWLDQNVSRERLGWFYHTDQGTRTFGIPYEWFIALEQPTIPWLVFTSVDLLREQAYLDRYGFIPEKPVTGQIVLPIGFAKGGPMLDSTGTPWRNPHNRSDMNGIGLTCACPWRP